MTNTPNSGIAELPAAAAPKSKRASPRMDVPTKIKELAQLTKNENWDDEGGVAISRADWDRALKFYQQIRSRANPSVPFIAPCGDGSIHFNWSDASGRSLNLELKDNTFWWSSTKPNADRIEVKCNSLDELEARTIQYFSKRN